jgi:aldose 1-epimerase
MNDSAKVDASFVWRGVGAVLLAAGPYEAVAVPSVGGNLISLRDTERGLDILRSPETADALRETPQIYGLPMLLFPNRIADGVFTAGGRTYRFPVNSVPQRNHLHGFLHHKPFTVARAAVVDGAAELELVFRFDAAQDAFSYFPREFTATQRYRLSADGLAHEVSVRNEGRESMPVGVAVHSNFRVPFAAGSGDRDCAVRAAIGRKWELDDRFLPTGAFAEYGAPERLIASAGFDPVRGEPLSGCFSAESSAVNRASISDARAGLRVVYEPDAAFKFWVLWNKDGRSGFVSLEPQSWVINAPNLSLPDADTGMRMLAPGEEWRGECRLRAERIG